MNTQITDGRNSKTAKVDENNQLHTFAVTRNVIEEAEINEDAYNINTGVISLTTNTASALLYFKNNEEPFNGESRIIVNSIVIGVNSAGTQSQESIATVIKNPTTGSIVSNATNVDMNVNRNFGSNTTLTSVAYKGAEGRTFTDGTDFAVIQCSAGSRNLIPLGIVLEKGNSLGVKMNPYTTGGTTGVYVALVLHRVDGNNE